MSKIVYKKILPQYFADVSNGTKTFELRKDEDDIQVDDMLILNEFDGKAYTGQYVGADVKYVLRDCPQYGLMQGFCIIGLSEVKILKLNDVPKSYAGK